MVQIKDLSDQEITDKISSMRHNRDMGYPFDLRKFDEYADEAQKRGLDF